MKQKITKQGLFAIAAKTIDEKRPQVVALMQRYGMNVSTSDSNEKIDATFLALIRTSRGFRKDFSKLAVSSAQELQDKYTNMSGYLNETGSSQLKGRGISTGGSTISSVLEPVGQITTTKTPSGTTTTTTTREKGKLGSWVGEVFDKDTMQNIINTGLGIWAYQKTGGGISTGGANPIDQGRNENQGGTQGGGQGDNDKDKGIGVGAIIGIVLVGVSLVGIVIYSLTKTKK